MLSPALLLEGPYVTAVGETTATVRAELRSAAPVSVELTPDAGDAGRRRCEGKAAAMQVVHCDGLAVGTRYAYALLVAGAPVARGHLVTAPPAASTAPQTFIVYGDDRTDDDAHAAVVRAMIGVPADFLVNTGDMVADGGSAANWATFFAIERDLLRERPLFAAIGNHELYDDAAGANFARYFGFEGADGAPHPYGTLRFGAVRFFFLNGVNDFAGGPERAWLERALASADGEPGLIWRIAVVHQGPWSSGPHGPNARLVAAGVPQLLAAHRVDLVLSGHDHLYERGDAGALKYIVTGGGGAPVYRDIHPTATTRKVEPVHHFVEVTTTPDVLRIVAIRADGTTLDRCGFAKGGPWDCDAPAISAPAPPPASAGPGRSASVTRAPGNEGSGKCDVGAGAGGGPGADPLSIALFLGALASWVLRIKGD
ncbi:MAG TPA: metallophosphoesterase [Polyangiaceae bacterium]|jgi:hypothetical protein|nr:metallophosphoesterase [Polyangiaceae bacterium]